MNKRLQLHHIAQMKDQLDFMEATDYTAYTIPSSNGSKAVFLADFVQLLNCVDYAIPSDEDQIKVMYFDTDDIQIMIEHFRSTGMSYEIVRNRLNRTLDRLREWNLSAVAKVAQS